VLSDEMDKGRAAWNKIPSGTAQDRTIKSKAAIEIVKSYVELGQAAKAKALLEKALKIDPENAELIALKSEVGGKKSTGNDK
jgi:Tfp pilus assembly protein PilF